MSYERAAFGPLDHQRLILGHLRESVPDDFAIPAAEFFGSGHGSRGRGSGVGGQGGCATGKRSLPVPGKGQGWGGTGKRISASAGVRSGSGWPLASEVCQCRGNVRVGVALASEVCQCRGKVRVGVSTGKRSLPVPGLRSGLGCHWQAMSASAGARSGLGCHWQAKSASAGVRSGLGCHWQAKSASAGLRSGLVWHWHAKSASAGVGVALASEVCQCPGTSKVTGCNHEQRAVRPWNASARRRCARLRVQSRRGTPSIDRGLKIAARSDECHERADRPIAIGVVDAADRLAGDLHNRMAEIARRRQHSGRDVRNHIPKAVDPQDAAADFALRDARGRPIQFDQLREPPGPSRSASIPKLSCTRRAP